MRATYVACLCVSLAVFGAFVDAENAESGLLEVVVTDSSKPANSLAGVSVAVVAKDPNALGAAGLTDAAGRWTGRVSIGTYRITASQAGFKESTRTVVVFRAGTEPPRAKPVIFKLRPAEPEAITIDDTCAIDHLRTMGGWTICARDLDRIPFD